MDTTFGNNMAKSGASMVDKAADKLQSGIRDVQLNTADAGAAVAGKIAGFSTDAQHAVNTVADKAKQGIPKLQDAVQKTEKSLSNSFESMTAFTKEPRANLPAASSQSGPRLPDARYQTNIAMN